MAFPKVKISDDSGNTVGITSNTLDVNLAAGATIDIGDVEILGHSSITGGKNSTVGTSAERITASGTPCKHVDIMAHIDNTGIIYVGGSTVTNSTGIALYAGDVYSVDIDDVSDIYVMASVDGEDVAYVHYN
jgi:hypothetical protein